MRKKTFTRKWFHWLGICAFTITLSAPLLLKSIFWNGASLEAVSQQISRSIQNRELLAIQELSSINKIKLEALPDKYEYTIYQPTESYWKSKLSAFPLPIELVDSITKSKKPVVWSLPSGTFLFNQIQSTQSEGILCIPLQTFEPTLFKDILSKPYTLSSSKERVVAINNKHGNFLFSITIDFTQTQFFKYLSILFIVGFFTSFIYLFHLFFINSSLNNTARPLVFLSISIFYLCILKVLDYQTFLDHISLVKYFWAVNTGFFKLGEYLILGILGLFSLVAFPLEQKRFNLSGVLLSGIIFSTIGVSWWALALLNQWLFFEIHPIFSLQDIYQFTPGLVVKMTVIILALLIQYFGVQHSIHYLKRRNLSRKQWQIGLFIGLGFTVLTGWLIPIPLPFLPVLLISLIYLLLWDLFVDHPLSSLTWTFIWLIFYASISAGLCFLFQINHLCKEGWDQASNLLEGRDIIAEAEMATFEDQLSDHFEAYDIALAPLNKAILAKQLFTHTYLNSDYFFKHYTLRQSKIPDVPVINQKPSIYNSSSLAFTSDKKALSWSLEFNHPSYFYRLWLKRTASFSRINKRIQLKHSDFKFFHLFTSKRGANDLLAGIVNRESKQGYDLNASRLMVWALGDKGNVVILSKPMGGYFEPFSIFSLIFISMLISIYLIYLLTKFKLLELNASYLNLEANSISSRFQINVIGIILSSFLIIGVISISFFNNSNYIDRKSKEDNSINELVMEVNKLAKPYDVTANIVPARELTTYFPQILALYDRNGSLIYSKDTVFSQIPFISKRIDSSSRSDKFELFLTGDYFFPNRLRVFKFSKKTNPDISAMVFLLDDIETGLTANVSAFLGKLMNVYVFLLLISGAIAILVTNHITSPIVALGENLNQLKLGKNKPLPWQSQDEIGRLIGAYNSMLKALEEQTMKLKASEREAAWREMAKQVAHEIKNPLTPMRLHIQYLLRIQHQTPPDQLEGLIKKLSKTLIEQIDSLSRIATEFSNFAKMPQAKFEIISLTELVHSIYDLYKKQENEELFLTSSFPSEDIMIKGDGEQLLRVFSNLIKNGIQAIPNGRIGRISLSYSIDQNMITLFFKDNGTGIPEELQAKVFVPNFTTKSSGSGLGLAISKNIIEAHGGKIYFDTKAGEGTTFIIELPFLEEV